MVPVPDRSRFIFLAILVAACETPEFGTTYVWRRAGLTVHERPAATSKPIARIAFGQAVRLRSAGPVEDTVRIDTMESKWRAVAVGRVSGFLADAFLARLAPPATCESFANYLAGLEKSGEALGDPLVEEIDRAREHSAPSSVAASQPDDIERATLEEDATLPPRRKRTTTRYRNGITVIDEVAPRFASISITIENFPVIAGFELARLCNPIFFADRPFPTGNFREERRAGPRSGVDRARYSRTGSPLLFENQTETEDHIEKTTVHPLRKGALRIKYFFAALE